ncbi:MAG TPA: hypothetical protein VIF15_19770 [Polyangiaceae bacterium]
MRSSIVLSIACALVATACSSAPQEPSPSGSAGTGPSTSPAAPADVRAGFVHAVERSRFRVGDNPAERLEFGSRKIVGDEGVFATRPTGLVLAISNADAPTRARPPLPGGAEAHDALVRSYFLGAGLPADQMRDVSPYAVVSKVGRSGPDFATLAGSKLEYYFSTVSRQIDGIPVSDSFAWARLDADGNAVLESVYWPEIPAQVVRDALAFEARLEDAPTRAALLARVPREGKLVIHHTPGEWDGAFEATATYDVGEERGKVSHFDVEGRRIELSHERENAWGDLSKGPPRLEATP